MPPTNFSNDQGDGVVIADGFLTKQFSAAAQDSITAFAGGGQASATLLTAQNNNVTTVATAADSVKLPPVSRAGIVVRVRNSGANSMQVFGSGTDTINGVATATGVAQAAGTSAEYWSVTSGTGAKWFRNLSA